MKRKCARCGRKLAPENSIRSRYSKAYYCDEMGACAKRTPKRQRSQRWWGKTAEAARPPHGG